LKFQVLEIPVVPIGMYVAALVVQLAFVATEFAVNQETVVTENAVIEEIQ
jgi:hypothetical protein